MGFIIVITLHGLVSTDHHQVCMNKNSNSTIFYARFYAQNIVT
jgi:hypothetical protein